MHDAHTHIQDEALLHILKEKNFPCIINASNKDEYEFLKKHRYPNMMISCGIHPWYVHTTDFDCFYPCLLEADFLGEIGLDKPWCDSDFELQKEMFIKQLRLEKNVVILHTKGYEKEVLDLISLYPKTYLVHWYSCEDYLDDYIKLGCYFSIGPSILNDDLMVEIASKIPLDRLLIETDGLEAITWALDCPLTNKDYFTVLSRMGKRLAEIKNVSEDEIKQNLLNNFKALTCI